MQMRFQVLKATNMKLTGFSEVLPDYTVQYPRRQPTIFTIFALTTSYLTCMTLTSAVGGYE
jgi:hypothetical protein